MWSGFASPPGNPTSRACASTGTPPWRQPRGKWMVSLVNSDTNATRIGWHLWEIDLRFAPGLPPGWLQSSGSRFAKLLCACPARAIAAEPRVHAPSRRLACVHQTQHLLLLMYAQLPHSRILRPPLPAPGARPIPRFLGQRQRPSAEQTPEEDAPGGSRH